jgi:outer membrane protein OmpA-like peptidoglycan-associated protein
MPNASACRSAGSAFILAALVGCTTQVDGGAASLSVPAASKTATVSARVPQSGAPYAGATPAAASTTATPPPKPPEAVPFDQAVLNAANGVLSKLPQGRNPVVIDPLVDGVTGQQTAATKSIQGRIAQLARDKYPQLDVEPFTSEAVHQAPIVLVGTFTPVDKNFKTAGDRDSYRFCLVALDLRSGTTVAKSVARALPAGVDPTPLGAFNDSPVWTNDRQIQSYVASCQQSKVGDPINKTYADGILAAAVISDAVDAYNARHYAEARNLYTSALHSPAGDQLRVWNGLYLTNRKLGNRGEAEDAFVNLVDYGLRTNRLGVKFLFRPGSVDFASEGNSDYNMWLRDIASRAQRNQSCLEVTGHTSKTGPAALNDRLSLLRAEYIKQRLEQTAPALAQRTIANGVGSRENLVGTGTDNEADALDRRVEFKVIQSCT